MASLAPESTQGRKAARKAGLALPPATPGAAPGFPVTDPGHWDKARQAVGRVKDPKRKAALAALLRKTAARYGRAKELGESWAAPGGSSHANTYARTVDMSQDALASVLALRGASDPQALAAWIARRRSGASLANPDLGIYLAETTKDEQGHTLTCPECGHVAPAGDFGASGTSLDKSPGDLRTPQPSTGFVRKGAAVSVGSGSAAHALANGSARRALELAAGTLTAHRRPIQGPADVLVARAADGTAVLRHRQGGAEIAHLRKTDGGKWVATVNGRDLSPRDHQRTALMEAVGTWNGAVTGALHRAEAPLQPPPQQTELMAEYGIPAIRALATPAAGAGDGPPDHHGRRARRRDSTDDDGLTPRGQAIKKKLIAKGFPEARAVTFAKMAQKTKPGQFGKQARPEADRAECPHPESNRARLLSTPATLALRTPRARDSAPFAMLPLHHAGRVSIVGRRPGDRRRPDPVHRR